MTQALYYSNFSVPGTVGNSGGITAIGTSLYLSSTPSGYPGSFPFKLVLDAGTASEEIVLVTAGNGTSGVPWVITRGYNDSSGASTAHSHGAGSAVQHVLTAGDAALSRIHEAETTYASGPPHGLPASAWQAAAVTALDEVTISGSTTASQTWSSIPGTYQHLLIVAQGKFTESTLQSDDLLVTLNGDTGAHYSYVEQFVTNVAGGSTGALFSGTNTGSAMNGWPLLRLAASQSGAAANAGGGTAWIPNYTSATFNKCFTSQSGAGDGSSAFVDMRTRSGWFNPSVQAAVTSITLTAPGSLFFTSGTFLGLYGLS